MTRIASPFSLCVAVVILGFSVLFVSGRGNAQVAGATVTGSITDPSSRLIPGARVTVTDTATGIASTVITNSAGIFTVPNLVPGPYDVKVSAKGFRNLTRTGITLEVGAQQVLNMTMTMGVATQTINVTGQTPSVDLSSSSISATVDEVKIRELPLNGRDWTTLATLQPGVNSLSSVQTSNFVAGFVRGNRGLGFQMAVSGARPQLNNYRIDGITVNDYVNGGPGSVQGGTLGVDAIQEFSVLTSNYTAEYGRTAGGVVNAITRSGTNRINGSAFEFIRNSALDAANYFDNFTNTPKPPFKQNQFGAAVGGPIRKDKTFFFANYEGLRTSQSSTALANVPSPDARNGILHNPDGSTCTIGINRAPGTLSPTDPGCKLQNSEGTVGVDPKVAPYLALYGLPNAGLYPDQNTGIFAFAGKSVTDENFYTGRVDNNFSPNDRVFASGEYDHSRLTLPDAMNDVSNLSETTRALLALEETHVFSPKLANTFRVGYSRSFAEAAPPLPINPAAADKSLGPATGAGTPNLSVGSLSLASGTGGAVIYLYPYNSFQFYDDAFFSRGRHDLKFGAALERDQLNSFFNPGAAGTFQFSSLTNFLLNIPASIRDTVPGLIFPRYWRQTIPAAYIQDNMKWRPNLTINIGLRYEMATVVKEKYNKIASLHQATDPAPTLGAPFYQNPTIRNFAPRLGFAWDPSNNGRTSVRGSFGLFDILPLLSEISYKDTQSAPYNEQGNGKQLPQGSFPATAFSLSSVNSKLRTFYLQQKPKRDYRMTWNLSIERQITQTVSTMVAYVGSHGVHEPFAVDDMNIVLPTKTAIGYLWPYPVGSGNQLNSAAGTAVGRIDHLEWTNSTLFDGLEAQLTKSMSNGIQVQAAYTWSKAIDDGDGINIGDPFANSISSLLFFDPKLRRGLADYNVAHNLTLNYDWRVPGHTFSRGFASAALGGWELGGIITLRTGVPFTPNLAGAGNGSNGDPLGLNNSDPFDFPNRITTGACHSPVNAGSVVNYLKLNCFTLPTAPDSYAAQCGNFSGATTPPPAGSVYCANLLGNLSRNSVIGPGLFNVDFSIFKNFPFRRISESASLQFRSEFFNVFNHANFNAPIDNSNIFDVNGAPVGGAGLIDSTSTTAREIQFGLKLLF